MIVYNYTGYVNRELKEIIVGGIFQGKFFKADASGRDLLCWQRGQGNFELNSHARLACYTMNKTGVASGSFS